LSRSVPPTVGPVVAKAAKQAYALGFMSPLVADTVEKSFLADERKFSGPLMRFARGDVRDHNAFYKDDH